MAMRMAILGLNLNNQCDHHIYVLQGWYTCCYEKNGRRSLLEEQLQWQSLVRIGQKRKTLKKF